MHDHRKLLSRNAFAASALTLVGVLGGGAASARTVGDECRARPSPLQAAALCARVDAPAGAVHAANYRGTAAGGLRMATITTSSAHRDLQSCSPSSAAQDSAVDPDVAYA